MTSYLHLPPLLLMLFVPIAALVAIVLGLPAQRTAAVAMAFNAVLALGICILILIRPVKASLFEVGFLWAQAPGWPAIHCQVGLNGLSALLLLVVTWVSFLAVTRMPLNNAAPGVFASCLLVLNASALGVLLFEDVFGLVFFLLLLVLPPFLLIGKWGGHNRQLGAFQATVSLVMAVAFISTGLVELASRPSPNRGMPIEFSVNAPDKSRIGTPWGYSMASIGDDDNAYGQELIFGFILAGSVILMGLVPAHGWILSGYGSAPVSLAIVMSGTISCTAFYFLAHWGIDLQPIGYSFWKNTMLALGALSLLYAGTLTWDMREIRQVLGADCVAQRGLVFIGLGCPTALAHTGAALLIIGEALSSACLLGLAAELEQFLGDNRIRELSVRSFPGQPVLTGWMLAATWAACSLPLSVNFIGVVLILEAAYQTGGPFALLALLAGLFIAASGLVQMTRTLFFPEPSAVPVAPANRSSEPGRVDLTLLESAPYALLLLLSAAAGCFPNVIIHLLNWPTSPNP